MTFLLARPDSLVHSMHASERMPLGMSEHNPYAERLHAVADRASDAGPAVQRYMREYLLAQLDECNPLWNSGHTLAMLESALRLLPCSRPDDEAELPDGAMTDAEYNAVCADRAVQERKRTRIANKLRNLL